MEQGTRHTAWQTIQGVARVEQLSGLLHELQKERALPLTFLASGGNAAKEELFNQREITDRAAAALIFDGKSDRDAKAGVALDTLPVVRARVNGLAARSGIDSFYVDLKEKLLDEIAGMIRASGNLTLKNHLVEHLYLLISKDFLAGMRSKLGSVLAAGRFSGTEYGSFASLKGKYEVNLQKFTRIASFELRQYFDKRFQGTFVSQTQALIDAAYNNPSLPGSASDADP